jgi:hypothetical protein
MYFGPEIGVFARCGNIHIGGKINARPACGLTDMSREGKHVSPPSVTSFRYQKKARYLFDVDRSAAST